MYSVEVPGLRRSELVIALWVVALAACLDEVLRYGEEACLTTARDSPKCGTP